MDPYPSSWWIRPINWSDGESMHEPFQHNVPGMGDIVVNLVPLVAILPAEVRNLDLGAIPLGRRKLENLPDRPRLFFERMLLSRKTIKLVVAAQQKGIDVDEMLEEILTSE